MLYGPIAMQEDLCVRWYKLKVLVPFQTKGLAIILFEKVTHLFTCPSYSFTLVMPFTFTLLALVKMLVSIYF